MTEPDARDRVAALRLAFDRSFAAGAGQDLEARVVLLALRVAGTRCLVRLDEVARLMVDRRIVPLPSSAPALLGVAGVRGAVAPVYSLRAILGHPPAAGPPRWILLARSSVVGFAFEQLDGYLSVPSADIAPSALDAARAHLREVARTDGAVVPIVSVASIIDSLQQEKR